MTTEISALLLYDSPDPLNMLRTALQGTGLKVRQARTCAEAGRLLSGPKPPDLVFTDIKLPDGNWSDVVRLAEVARAPVNVIVVSRLVDIPLYVQAIEEGAFDFITPPFEPTDVAHIIRCAAGNVKKRREICARSERSAQAALPAVALQSIH